MTHSSRHTISRLCVVLAACAAPALALAQNAPPDAAAAANAYGNVNAMPAPAERVAKNRINEQDLLGAPRDYGGDDTPQRSLGDAQRTAILDEQRIAVNGGAQQGAAALKPAAGKAQRQAPGAANGAMRVAGRAGRPGVAEGLTPEGAARNAYADPYASKRAVYRSPW